MHDPAVVADWYRRSEANCRLEGFDPADDIFYQQVKARVIAGELTIMQASDLLTEDTQQKAFQHAPALAAKR